MKWISRGKISWPAFDPLTGVLQGALQDTSGNPLVIEGLRGLLVGNGGNGGDLNSVYFTAGIPGSGHVEDHGLFGRLTSVRTSVPESGSTLFLMAITCVFVGLGYPAFVRHG